MKQLGLALISCVLVAPAFALNIGDKIPAADVKMKSVDGKELTIEGIVGKEGTLVVFTCNSCPFAQAWEGRIVELSNEYAGKGFGVIAVNANDPAVNPRDGFDEMVRRAQAGKYEFPYVVDATSEVARAFGAARTPECFLFDKSGKLVYHGAVDDDKNGDSVSKHYLQDALVAMLAGKEIATPETKSVGCGIKFHKKD